MAQAVLSIPPLLGGGVVRESDGLRTHHPLPLLTPLPASPNWHHGSWVRDQPLRVFSPRSPPGSAGSPGAITPELPLNSVLSYYCRGKSGVSLKSESSPSSHSLPYQVSHCFYYHSPVSLTAHTPHTLSRLSPLTFPPAPVHACQFLSLALSLSSPVPVPVPGLPLPLLLSFSLSFP